MEKISQWIGIEKLSNDGKKTETFEVWNIFDNCSLGIIKWKTSWRKYAFFPYDQTCFEKTCLNDIADFIYKTTKEYKKAILKPNAVLIAVPGEKKHSQMIYSGLATNAVE